MLAEKNQYINNAYEQLQIISQDKQKQMEYTARMKAVLDYNQGILEARQEGKQEGLEIGIKNLIISYIEDDFPKEKIIEKLQKRFNLTKEQAEQYFSD